LHCAEEAASLLRNKQYLSFSAESPKDIQFKSATDFSFTSAVVTPWAENNLVHGKLFKAGSRWRERASVVLVHGWNGELGYRYQFPALAWRLARAGLNVAMLELPYHAQRKPRNTTAITNFISHDLFRMAEATRQATSDVRSLVAWLHGQAAPSISLWGISLGAWLAGLVACHEPRVNIVVLMSPVVRMDRAVAELPFCEPVRRSLEQAHLPLDAFNLISYRPLPSPENILLIESRFDLFASVETVEELWRAWGQPNIWRLRHGHISILASPLVMERTVRWLVRATRS
jgi:pimeloyl-ACP methyl ester carboxylesterase